jgi:hypothetical protein
VVVDLTPETYLSHRAGIRGGDVHDDPGGDAYPVPDNEDAALAVGQDRAAVLAEDPLGEGLAAVQQDQSPVGPIDILG